MKHKSIHSYKDFKRLCMEKRFFKYDNLHDRVFVEPAILISWICVYLNISANQISWFSGFVAILGGILLATQDYLLVFIGSLSFLMWYLLDYVDGSIARYQNTASIEGQYIDWLMNVIASISITIGISVGGVLAAGPWVIPFMISAILASVLSYERNSMAWFSIIMQYQQNKNKEDDMHIAETIISAMPKREIKTFPIKKIIMLVFHENYMIFILPLLAFMQLIYINDLFDFRVVFTVLAGTLNFSVMIMLINDVIREKKASKAYNNLFVTLKKPDLPKDHFFDD
tara:strand:+ start:1382 stop:2236 length:855 start_codon:yes stop_codon:yes gene_type:complete